MEYVIAVVIGALFMAGVYLLLSRTLLRILVGTALLSYGSLLFLLTMGKLKRGVAPIIDNVATAYTDPLPQALILTAIVIGFGVTAFIVVLSFRANQEMGSDDTEDFRGIEEAQEH